MKSDTIKIPEIEIIVRYKNGKNTKHKNAKTVSDLYLLARDMFNADQMLWVEEFIMFCMNSAGEVIGYYKVSKGGMSSTIVDVKVIATVALQSLATSVVIAHNHPSGNLQPSSADNEITSRIQDALQLLDILLIDHLIISPTSYYSYRTEGLLKIPKQ